MTPALIALLLPAMAGYAMLRASRPFDSYGTAFLLSLGATLGLGGASCMFFVWLSLGGSPDRVYAVGESAIMLTLLCTCAARKRANGATKSSQPGASLWVLMVVAIAAVLSFIAMCLTSPYGSWDGWAVWNMRARFMFRGGFSLDEALINAPVWSHPDYPLMLPGSIARIWSFAGSEWICAPAVVAGVFAACVVCLTATCVARLKGRKVGIMAALLLLGAEYFSRHAAMQYADIPLSLFMVAGLIMVSSTGSSVTELSLAGLLASLAAWTKNEGIVFCTLMVAAYLVRPTSSVSRLRGAGIILLGMLPVGAILIAFKVWLTPSNDLVSAMNLQDLSARVLNAGRWVQVLGFFGRSLVSFSGGVFSLLLVRFLLMGRNIDPHLSRATSYSWLLIALMLVADTLIFVVTPQDLDWHLKTSGRRMVLQLFPMIVFAGLISADSESHQARAVPIKTVSAS